MPAPSRPAAPRRSPWWAAVSIVVYPRRNGPLWREVARRGVVWSEYPLGTPALAWHFPARNRLIAALADVVVVVESHAAGGRAADRGAGRWPGAAR